MRRVGLVVLYAAALSVFSAATAEPVRADGAWLDAPLVPWNAPGMAVPAAPPPSFWPSDDPQCAGSQRPPEILEDQVVIQAGWKLIAGYEGGWGVKVVSALSGYDGMCRALGYQWFVFVDGAFAGTLSPGPMDSRADGALSNAGLGRDAVVGEFMRYAPTDGLCCPSRVTNVQYRIDRTEAGPVVVPASVFTYPRPG